MPDTPRTYEELEKLVADIIEANEYTRPEITAANLLSALAALDLHVVAGSATDGMLRAGYAAVLQNRWDKDDDASIPRWQAMIAAKPLRKE